ncbi:aldehyde dehydrogenase (NADP(+)) [Dactylosporangium sp. NBC_01737]|uniref:aldehyde dehydrogenase (NADP(+)) n=1 Tax=Dactylosporangium sp. NBC_01737 TaxID=2975959 RepID=UPI002E1369D5|nr:aldehyde dehydrogenase (NADP(+)) [Dactylosporangium sp. NBC_01737]
MIVSIDPSTGAAAEVLDVPAEDLDRLGERAHAAHHELEGAGRSGRAAMLRAMAAAVEERRTDLVAVADRETGLGPQRLNTELTRTVYQLGFFADVLDDGAYLEAAIDHAGSTPMGPRPDLRRMLVPLGPVAVFGAANFPFAFSVPGGDTASALAAGCPVITKVHPAHPATSLLSRDALLAGARAAGLSTEVVSLVYSDEAAARLVQHPDITAVGFTGSLRVGRLLADLAAARPAPIPFYGELGAVNAFVVGRAAARDRGAQIGDGLAASFMLGVGQFCTKPGIAVVPAGAAGAALTQALVDRVAASGAGIMLSERIAGAYADGTGRLLAAAGVEVLARGGDGPAEGFRGTPLLLRARPDALEGPLLEECFGPELIVVEYDTDDDALAMLRRFGPALTATIHADDGDRPLAARLLDHAQRTAGRVVWNGYPTGVAVAWAMHHGGPYPATTNALHTSVGTSAIRRWLRPVCFQDVPQELLPDELRDVPEHGSIPRRVSRTLVLG